MDKLKVLIVEDNSLIAFELSNNIEKMGHEVVDTVSTAVTAEAVLQNQEVDLAILDITIKGDRDGISVAKTVEEMGIPFIYLTSYYDEATLDRVNETNYAAFIAKPYTELDLKLNIELARRKSFEPVRQRKKEYYTYTDNKMTKKVYFNDVLYVKSDDNYSVFNTQDNKKILVRIPLKNLEEELADDRFYRIHRSYMINSDKIQSFSNNTVIINGENIPISNSHRKEFKEFIKELWG
ncbi:MAG: LytTR family transcriptional regulator DNA-binding domain-containing protein [Bacteroidia bacterium]